jgi:hypothetical protein
MEKEVGGDCGTCGRDLYFFYFYFFIFIFFIKEIPLGKSKHQWEGNTKMGHKEDTV